MESGGRSPLLEQYPLFKTASDLRGMQNIQVHRCGLPGPGVDWKILWTVFDTHLEMDLLPKLEQAITVQEDKEDVE